MKEVILNEIELAVAHEIARLRDASHTENTNLMGVQVEDASYNGACGEMAYAKLFNVYFNIGDIKIPWDVIHNGFMLDIKCSTHDHMHIHPKCANKQGIDGFAYMQKTGDDTFVYRGKISKGRLLRDFEPQPSTYSDCYIVKQEDLVE